HQHALAPRPRHAYRVEALAVHAGLDVEGEDAQRGRELRRREDGVAIHAADAGAPLERAVDLECPPDAAIDEPAVCEADVRLEAFDASPAEPGAHGGHVAGQVELDPRDRVASERA